MRKGRSSAAVSWTFTNGAGRCSPSCGWTRARHHGLGSMLIRAAETAAYVILSYCCDWVSGFFFQNGFTPRGELKDYPKGHTAYELEKRI